MRLYKAAWIVLKRFIKKKNDLDWYAIYDGVRWHATFHQYPLDFIFSQMIKDYRNRGIFMHIVYMHRYIYNMNIYKFIIFMNK